MQYLSPFLNKVIELKYNILLTIFGKQNVNYCTIFKPFYDIYTYLVGIFYITRLTSNFTQIITIKIAFKTHKVVYKNLY